MREAKAPHLPATLQHVRSDVAGQQVPVVHRYLLQQTECPMVSLLVLPNGEVSVQRGTCTVETLTESAQGFFYIVGLGRGEHGC